jgi:hypothetical protein
MKKIYLTLAFTIITNLTISAQDALTFEKIIQTDSISKEKLFVAFNDWVASEYNSANDVIQMSDKDAGVIIGNGSMKYSYGKFTYVCYDGHIKYTIKVYLKDNKYKVILTNFRHFINAGNGAQCKLGLITNADVYATKGFSKKYHNKVWNSIKSTTEIYANKIFSSLEDKTKNMSNKSTDQDW